MIGQSARLHLNGHPPAEKLLARMREMFEAGEPFTDAVIDRLAEDFNHDRSPIFWAFLYYISRDLSVHWLCSLADEIDVEVYGPYWEEDEVVRPFYKGLLSCGEEVAAVYNEAQYTLAPHYYDLTSQRLTESAACGTIPIAYDCRYRAGTPHWEKSSLWYRTKEDIRACLTQKPSMPLINICKGRTATDFAKRILTDVKSHLSWQ